MRFCSRQHSQTGRLPSVYSFCRRTYTGLNGYGKLVTTEPEEQASATPSARETVTQLLQELSGGDQQALNRLVPLVYEQLRKLAARFLRSERPDHTLRATA